MRVTYTPRGEQAQTWTWNPDDVHVVEAEAIERRSGETWEKFRLQVMQGSMRARRVLLWHLQKQKHPALKFEDVVFRTGELEVEMERAELVAMRDRLTAASGLTEEERERVLDALDAQITEAAEKGESDSPGKALSPTSAASTGP